MLDKQPCQPCQLQNFPILSESTNIVKIVMNQTFIDAQAKIQEDPSNGPALTNLKKIVIELRTAYESAIAERVASSDFDSSCRKVVKRGNEDFVLYSTVWNMILKNSTDQQWSAYSTVAQEIIDASTATHKQTTADPSVLFQHAAQVQPLYEKLVNSLVGETQVSHDIKIDTVCIPILFINHLVGKLVGKLVGFSSAAINRRGIFSSHGRCTHCFFVIHVFLTLSSLIQQISATVNTSIVAPPSEVGLEVGSIGIIKTILVMLTLLVEHGAAYRAISTDAGKHDTYLIRDEKIISLNITKLTKRNGRQLNNWKELTRTMIAMLGPDLAYGLFRVGLIVSCVFEMLIIPWMVLALHGYRYTSYLNLVGMKVVRKKDDIHVYARNRFGAVFLRGRLGLIVVIHLVLGTQSYETMPDGCKGKNDRTCYPRKAVDELIALNADGSGTHATYGPMKDWDMSLVTDLSGLFNGKKLFNADLSSWNVSQVTTILTST